MGDQEALDALIAETKEKISALIAKPKMAEKLLSKPPFRFLYDIVTAITNTTGFGEGLYSGAELDPGTITEKNSKIDYLEKIFRLVGICKGSALEVKSLKVIQGLEPENTNKFLIALADCASNPSIDNEAAVARCLQGETPGQRPPPIRSALIGVPPAEAKPSGPSGSDTKSFDNDRKDSKMDADSKRDRDMDIIAPERGKSRGGTRGGKPNQATADVGLSGFAPAMASNLDAEIERCDGTEAMTQQLLGALITRPKLQEKLLAKPPFKFIHDIVMEVIRATGFANGLYNEVESDREAVTDKNQKINFLEKIMKVVGLQLNTLVAAKPAKIIAGHDPQLTNNFLQLLAVAAKNLPDSRAAVRSTLEQMGEGNSAGAMAQAKDEPPPSYQQAPPPQISAPPEPVRQSISTSRPAEPKEPINTMSRAVVEDKRDSTADDKAEGGTGEDGEEKRSARPTTARRRPPKIKDTANEVQSKDIAPVATKKAEGIIIDGANDDDDIPDESAGRLVDEMKAENKPSASAPAQSKLVQDIMSRQAEQEVAAGKRVEAVDESKNSEGGNAQGGSGIRLNRMKKSGSEKNIRGGTTATTTATASFGEGDLEKMRSSIQGLVQQTGPMGVVMDFVQEDISLMNAELHKWEEDCRKYEVIYEEAKRKTKEALHPLKLELADLEDQIAERMAKISAAKAATAKNDEKIVQMLRLMATS